MATQCPSCDYDLSGVTSEVCPECGTRPSDEHPAIDGPTQLALRLLAWGWLGSFIGRALGGAVSSMPRANEGTIGDSAQAMRLLQTPGLLLAAGGAGILAHIHGRGAGRRWPVIAAAGASLAVIASVTGWRDWAIPDWSRLVQPLTWQIGGDLALGLAVAALMLVSAVAMRNVVGPRVRRMAVALGVGAVVYAGAVVAGQVVAAAAPPPTSMLVARGIAPAPTLTYFQSHPGQRLPGAVIGLTRYVVSAGLVLMAFGAMAVHSPRRR